MERSEAETVLSTVEERLDSDPAAGLAGSGFWKVVSAAKQTPDLAMEFAQRIAAIDRNAFERWALLTVPLVVGTIAAVVVTVAGLVLVGLAYSTSDPLNGLLLLAGTGVLLVTTHGLAHLVVGRLAGIRFTHWFIGTIAQPQPGVKTDYATYLTTAARRRAWMHASGALMTKVLPFALLPAALIAGVPAWATILLVVIGVVSIITDILWSTKVGDWKKYRREMSFTKP
ncbi:MAG: hypothetical protein F4Y40_05130 [Acidimicrobiia bacterium]|nr:hypothetical protein [Acidimicrobiia bacterium]